jgi:hypothetical protein
MAHFRFGVFGFGGGRNFRGDPGVRHVNLTDVHAGAPPRNQNKTIGVTSLRQDRFPASGDFVLNCNLHRVRFRGLSPRTDQENMTEFQAAFGPSLLPPLILPLAVDRVSIGVPR